MDTLKDQNAISNAIATLKTDVETLLSNISSLEEYKTTLGNAWESDNATTLVEKYKTLIETINSACTNIKNYQGKLDKVVRAMIGFDQTINYAEKN